jgi:hypothetical protein
LIPALQGLINYVDLEVALVTADVMCCKRKTALNVVDGKKKSTNPGRPFMQGNFRSIRQG